MSKSSVIVSCIGLAVGLAWAPAAFALGRSAAEVVLNSYLVSYIQMEGFRVGCF